MPDQTTLVRAVADATGLARRKAFAAIREGRVSLAGAVVVDPSAPYAGGNLALDGAPVAAAARRVYLLLNKPTGVLSATTDSRGRRTVIDLVPARYKAPGLQPVGRLDLETSGLLILTNDGALTFRLTHPRHEIEKEYWAALESDPTDAQIAELNAGIEIDGWVRKPAGVSRLRGAAPYQLSVRLKEGRKRQVRRMLQAVGGWVVALRRVREGPLSLGMLAEGELRPLSRAEVAALLGEEPALAAAAPRDRRRSARRELPRPGRGRR